MPSQGVGGDAKGLSGPGERESGRMELGVRDDFLVEVPSQRTRKWPVVS